MEYRTLDNQEKHIGDFGRSTKREFDEAIAILPELIAAGRNGNTSAGITANNLLWSLANEGFSTRAIKIIDGVPESHFQFGN
jgi:hypothetical protein